MPLHAASLWLLSALRPQPQGPASDHLRRDVGLPKAGGPRTFGG